MKIVGISGAITGSKTKIAVQFALDHIQANHPGAETELIDLSQNEMIFSDGRDFRDYTGDTANVTATIMAADAILIGTPTYQASISGALKNVLDLLPERAFQEKNVAIITTAGSPKHYLVAELQLKPILAYMKARIAQNYVFIEERQYDRGQIVDDDVTLRLQRLADDLVYETQVRQEITKQKDARYDF
ncbi:NADH-dependent FMN reductase [Listeria weihenstephanensis FSL R9-0317]|uniref:FMN reductase n=1 Tax=Listeria weihenstephanensis TaxID=1006155 RepID=A0A1S7FSW0_9LIST|nr:NADPH-dependent FMN reductase [Listeria weihenstephanensis]AQY50524.1 FMN reductase [Listeria weihenstephanensis]EUJ41547.1 NADH-dependent FMN reductase [Listeria weihenstephanensis FSL R9-0317]